MKHANIAFFVPHAGCPHRCSFCDQHAISGEAQPPSPDEVCQTLSGILQQQNHRETEIAFFGGSFTAIERKTMVALLKAASVFIGPGRFSGIRISTRPDAIDREVLSILQAYRVTSIELGAQSMDERVLLLNHRGHTAQDVRRACSLIRETGFSLGLQMMTGLYGDTDTGALQTAKELAALHPDTMRIYPTAVLRGTGLERLFREGAYRPPGVEESIPLCAELLRYFTSHGIRVIRMGLHASPELEERLVAGAYHPAFRELCEGELLYIEMKRRLQTLLPGAYRITVHPTMVSRAVGQKKRNLQRLQAAGYHLLVRQENSLPVAALNIDRL
ncbi:MAG: radical SAM protein [Provencibacterium sp.]|jgi:histone acetyltransferase (RNA polymerase elongator complex component)|nr:radical SAM protein [Provencibacterium sp.]